MIFEHVSAATPDWSIFDEEMIGTSLSFFQRRIEKDSE
jgi:hypothetical protein